MVKEITPRDFLARRAAGENLLLLDVREHHELARASVPGILHIPMAQLPERLAELDPGAEIFVLCRSGARSMQVARFLKSRGYDRVHNVTGGMLLWAQEVDPSLRP